MGCILGAALGNKLVFWLEVPQLWSVAASDPLTWMAGQSIVGGLLGGVPCNPDTLAMAYAVKTEGATVPLTRYLDPQALVEGSSNTIVFERDENMKATIKATMRDQIFKLFSTNHSPDSQANCLSELMCCLPLVDAPALSYENVFRVLIVQFMDAYSLDVRALKKSCIHFAQPDGKMVPFESFNLLYRSHQRLRTIRASIGHQTARRKAPAQSEPPPAKPRIFKTISISKA